MSVFEYLVLFFTVILGGGMAFFVPSGNRKWLQLVLSFSGAYILGITVLHLMPGIFNTPSETMGLWILLGFFIQLFLEQLSSGVEHGHVHAHEKAKTGFAIQIMIGLCLHAFLEGMPLSDYNTYHQVHHGHDHDSNHLLIGIILHKIPAAFALVSLLRLSGFSKTLTYTALAIFASMSPLGSILISFLEVDLNTLSRLLAVVVGSFLHISTTILFEADASQHHRISLQRLAAIMAGLGISIFTIH